MRRDMRMGMGIAAGMLLWRLTGLLCGLLLLPALGLILMGAYIQASLLVCAAVAVHRGVWWLVSHPRRRA